jgi:DNA repair exonuclease SbcCD nuclease subunit
MKICLLGDCHFCYKNSFNEYYKKFYSQVFFPYLEANNIKTVVQFGDIFDNRSKLDIIGLEFANMEFFSKFTDAIRLVTLLGNHDIVKKNTLKHNSPNVAIDSSYWVNIVSKPFGFGNCLIIPWICEENSAEIFSAIEKTSCKFLFAHLELSGFEMNRGYIMENGHDPKLFSKFEKVFSGHYHCPSSGGNVVYLGTPYELTFSDCDDQKYFYIFDTETGDLEAIPNPYKMFHKIIYNEGSDYDLSSVENCIVKVIVEAKTDQMKYDIFMKTLTECNPMELKVVENFEQFGDEKIDVDNIDISDTLSLLSKYVEETSMDIDKGYMKNILNDLYNDAIKLEYGE